MIGLGLATHEPLREILCLGAHADDIEIGCGATIRRLVAAHPDATIRWIVLSADDTRAAEAEQSALDFLAGAGKPDVRVARFREGYFPWIGAELKDWFEEAKAEMEPDLVLTHARTDLHQDHRTVAELTWNTFRRHLILEYEIPKYDGDRPDANTYVPLTAGEVDVKVEALLRHFPSQRHRPWFNEATFRGVCALRGVECGAPTGFAEAFVSRKTTLVLSRPGGAPEESPHASPAHG